MLPWPEFPAWRSSVFALGPRDIADRLQEPSLVEPIEPSKVANSTISKLPMVRTVDRLINLRNGPDDLLDQWSQRAEAIGSEAIGDQLCLRAHAVADGNSSYDHASAFLHALLKALNQTQH